MANPPRRDRRRIAFALLVTACVATAVGYAAWAVRRSRAGDRPEVGGPVAAGDAAGGRALMAGTAATVMFRNDVAGEHWAQIALVPKDAPDGSRTIVPLRCLRLSFAAGRGICLAEEPGFASSYDVQVFGPDFRILHTVPLSGLPSRARVSPDGRYGATTVFVAGHSYSDGSFSTETMLIDLATGAKLGTLEEFTVLREGRPFRRIDFNFWGVTFAADGHRFYATLLTRGETYLVEGDISAHNMRVLRPNVECPSLSPDGTRIAFKKRMGGSIRGVEWRFHVLDLATMTERPLAEPRNVDDQIEWLDDHNVLYGVLSDVWTVPADGTGEPRRFLRRALSPAVVRSAVAPSPTAARTPAPRSTDIAVALSAVPNPALVGQDLTYTVTVSNRGSVDASDLGIDVRLSPLVTLRALGQRNPPQTPHGCSVPTGYVSCTLARLAPRESWSVDFTVIPTAPGPVRSRATVDAAQPDPALGNNSATLRIPAVARENAAIRNP